MKETQFPSGVLDFGGNIDFKDILELNKLLSGLDDFSQGELLQNLKDDIKDDKKLLKEFQKVFEQNSFHININPDLINAYNELFFDIKKK